MVNQKLQEIGQQLDVTEGDLEDIKKAGSTGRIIYWVITAIIALISLILGFFVGRGACPSTGDGSYGGYPFAMGLVIPAAVAGKSKSSKIAVLLISTITFLIAIKSYPVFGEAIKYNVYNRD
jgi:hypothetical protein